MPREDERRLFERHFDVSRETMERLDVYEALLRERGATLSLVGRTTFDSIWLRHFLDSAQLFPLLKANALVLDMGSGAGFPGMVLAIMGHSAVHLAENNQKKVAFLHEVTERTETPVVIHNVKAEALSPKTLMKSSIPSSRDLIAGSRTYLKSSNLLDPVVKPRDDDPGKNHIWPSFTIIARALAPLASLLELGERFFDAGAEALFLKGRAAPEEIDAARHDWDFSLETYPSLTAVDSSVLRLSAIKKNKLDF